VKIGPHEIGTGRAFITAEIGSNHNGSFDTALALVRAAAAAGADAVKFQTYHAEQLIDPTVPTMAHVRGVHKTQFERFKSLQFTPDQWATIASTAAGLGLVFFSTPFDPDAADLLDPLVPAFKIASADLTNVSLIRHVARKGKPVIVSTGMGTVDDIRAAAALVPAGQLVLLHCVSAYPTPMEAANLRAIPYLASEFPGTPVGYSDHTLGTLACLGAVALGAAFVEKHFTNDKAQAIGDHKLSADYDEFGRLVRDIRALEEALGTPGKDVEVCETPMLTVMRRGLAAARPIEAGTVLTADLLLPIRPLRGVPAYRFDDLVGKRVKRALQAAEFIEYEDVEW
jgi:sialic acid synthase SpsE